MLTRLKFSYLKPYTPLTSKPKLLPKPPALKGVALFISGASPQWSSALLTPTSATLGATPKYGRLGDSFRRAFENLV